MQAVFMCMQTLFQFAFRTERQQGILLQKVYTFISLLPVVLKAAAKIWVAKEAKLQ